jgi:hypothetical protein
MKALVHILALAIASIGLVSCADGDANTTSSLALSEAEAEALRACVTAIEDCRETATDSEDFRELCGELMACLPERDAARASGSDWRAYCRGVEERCADGSADEATCAELRERCEGDRSGGERSICYQGCLDAGGDDDGCRLECAEEPAEPPTYEECMADCTGQGIDDALCSERCEML